jgi:hypothetical protein
MHNYLKVLMVVAGLAAVAGTLLCLSGDDEPRHQGRALSEWLTTYYEADRPNQDPAQRLRAAAAIRTMGTNALPFLLKSIRYETPSWHRDVAPVLPVRMANSRPARATLYRRFHRAEAAEKGFRLLGSNALSAVPPLRSMLRDQTHPETALRALGLLGSLGAETFHVLEAALADTNHPYRTNIVACLAVTTARYVGTNACLPPLRSAMGDPDPNVRIAASNMVIRLTGASVSSSLGAGASVPWARIGGRLVR